jgi:hypothetical protein
MPRRAAIHGRPWPPETNPSASILGISDVVGSLRRLQIFENARANS